MTGRLLGIVTGAGLALALVAEPFGMAAVRAAPPVEPVRQLQWSHLIPTAKPKPRLKTFFAGRQALDPNARTLPQSIPEARWMSAPTAETKATVPPAVVQSLHGKRVNLGGYVVPLDFDATTIKEFLLVPFVGACIHVPPPPPNQIVYVKAAKGFQIRSLFQPVYVTGRLTTSVAFTGLADAGYTLEAEKVSPRKE